MQSSWKRRWTPPPLIDPLRDLDDLLRVDLAKRDAVNDLLRLR